jgi:hypothetical protein
VRPTSLLGDPKDVFTDVFVAVLGSGRIFAQQGFVPGLESQGDVAEEDKAKDNALIIGRLQVPANLDVPPGGERIQETWC